MSRAAWRRFGVALAGVWIFGTTAFYLIRFSAVFYRANAPAVDEAVSRVMALFGGS